MSWGNSKASTLYFKKKTGLWVGRQFDAVYDPKKQIATASFWTYDGHTTDVFLKRVNGRLLLRINYECPHDYKYHVRQLLTVAKVKFTEIHVNVSLDKLKTEGLKSYYEDLYALEARSLKKGIHKASREYALKTMRDKQKQIDDLKKLGAGYPRKLQKELRQKALDQVKKENADYTEMRRRVAKAPKAERDPIAAFKDDLLANSFRNVG